MRPKSMSLPYPLAASNNHHTGGLPQAETALPLPARADEPERQTSCACGDLAQPLPGRLPPAVAIVRRASQ